MAISEERMGEIALLVLKNLIKSGRMGGHFYITDDLAVIKDVLTAHAGHSGIPPTEAVEFGQDLVLRMLTIEAAELEAGRSYKM